MKWGFEDYTLDKEAFEIRKGEEPLAAEPQVLSLLILLIENRGKLLKKDDIIDAIWAGRAISDAALSSRVKSARQLIGDNGKDQRLIKTVYGNGLRFVGEVTEQKPPTERQLDQNEAASDVFASTETATASQPASATVQTSPRFRVAAGIVAILLAMAVLALTWLYVRAENAGPAEYDGEVIVAVVPFSAAQEQATATELSALLVTRLSDRSDFAMLSSTSSFSLAERGMTAAQIAQELGATHIIEGEQRRSGGQTNIDLRLIEGATQRQIWSHTVQIDTADPILLADMVVRHSAAAIQAYLEVGAGQVDIPSGTPQDAIRDYRIALEAELAYYGDQTRLEQHQLFDAARQQAPDWADAHGALAWSTLFARPDDLALTTEEHFAIMEEAIARALEIDPGNRWGRLSDGVYRTRYGTNFARALEVLEALVEDEPDWALARRMYAQALSAGGHHRDAIAQFEQIDALGDLPTWVGGFVRSHALRGIGQPMRNAVLAQSCEAQCFWIYSSWYDGILIKEHTSKVQLETDLADLASAIEDGGQVQAASQLGLGDDIIDRMAETALYLKGYGPEPENPFGRPSTLIRVAMLNGDRERAFDNLEFYSLDWMPATTLSGLLYDDAIGIPEAVRADPRYHAVFALQRMRPLVEYRQSQGFTAGLPVSE